MYACTFKTKLYGGKCSGCTWRSLGCRLLQMIRGVLQALRIVGCCIRWTMPRRVLCMLWKAAGCGVLQMIWVMQGAVCVV